MANSVKISLFNLDENGYICHLDEKWFLYGFPREGKLFVEKLRIDLYL